LASPYAARYPLVRCKTNEKLNSGTDFDVFVK
jgi:hypothetical protein